MDVVAQPKGRAALTQHQMQELEHRYKIQKYLSSAEREHFAREIQLDPVQVKIWFENQKFAEKAKN